MMSRAATSQDNGYRRYWGLGALFLVVVVAPVARSSNIELTPYAKVSEDHDSNIFAFPSPGPALPPGTLTAAPDWRTSYVVGADASGDVGRQKLTARLEGRRMDFRQQRDLDHNESLVAAELGYGLGDTIDGRLRAKRELRMAPFTQRVSDALSIETERNSFASIRFKMTADLFLQPDVGRRDLTSPQQLYPNLRLREDTAGVLLTYAGLRRTRVGLEFDHLAGAYSGAPGVPNVSQRSAQVKVKYEATGLSTLIAALGGTQRDQGTAANNISAVTGAFGYRRMLTGKTSVSLDVTRAVNSYVTAGNSEIDTSASLGVEWLPTRKLSVFASYARTHGVFVGDILPGEGIAGRRDTYEVARLNLDYRARQWLSIRPYLQYQRRISNDPVLTFHDTMVGIELTARPGRPGVERVCMDGTWATRCGDMK